MKVKLYKVILQKNDTKKSLNKAYINSDTSANLSADEVSKNLNLIIYKKILKGAFN